MAALAIGCGGDGSDDGGDEGGTGTDAGTGAGSTETSGETTAGTTTGTGTSASGASTSGGTTSSGSTGAATSSGGSSTGGADMGSGQSCVIHVNQAGGLDTNPGMTWLAPKATVQAGIDAAVQGECGEVWVAAGTYRPTDGADRNATIQLAAEVGVYGGFAGGESNLDERDWVANKTVLSGDIGVASDDADNSFHVVTAADDARLDGFEVRHGFSEGDAAARVGAGVLSEATGFALANCVVAENRTGDGIEDEFGTVGGDGGHGAGMYQRLGSARIDNVTFTNNSTGNGAPGSVIGGFGGWGAGLYAESPASLEIVGSRFIANHTGDGAGGGDVAGAGGPAALVIRGDDPSTVVLRDTLFESNTVGIGSTVGLDAPRGYSGGLYAFLRPGSQMAIASCEFVDNEGSAGAGANIHAEKAAGAELIVVNTLFAANDSDSRGGGLVVSADGTAKITLANDTFVGNDATDYGGGLLFYSFENVGVQTARVVNSIVWGNTAPTSPNLHALPTLMDPQTALIVDHTNIEGGCVAAPTTVLDCVEALDQDPMFENALTDFHLQPGSPLVNAGDATLLPADLTDLDDDADVTEPTPLDLDGLARVAGAEVDLGVYEEP